MIERINNLELNHHDKIPHKLPFLEDISWQTENVYKFSPREMLKRYERGWKYRDIFKSMTKAEKEFIKQLSLKYDSWLDTEL